MHNIQFESINELTEYSCNFVQVNRYMADCYNGLQPSSLGKLANIIFHKILSNKKYRRNKDDISKTEEDKRIYSNIDMKYEIILRHFNPKKFNYLSGSFESDRNNICRKFKKLHDDNIIYLWKYHSEYIFIMERYISSWKYYNPDGTLSPKTLSKIVTSGQHIINTMIHLLNMDTKKRNVKSDVDKNDVESKFGYFINKMIHKLNPSVLPLIKEWKNDDNIYDYLVSLAKELNKIRPNEGIIENDKFIDNLPPYSSYKLRKIRKDKEEKAMTHIQVNSSIEQCKEKDKSVENELIPNNPNLIKIKKETKIVKKSVGVKKENNNIDHGKSIEATFYSLNGTVNPLKNVNKFMKYYRMYLSYYKKDVILPQFSSDTTFAGIILDSLRDNGRNNKNFLDSWLNYFIDAKLKGDKHLNPQYTSMKTFLDTFDHYNRIYLEPISQS